MQHVKDEYRKLRDLKKGDIINMRIPFEENTRDYYNGYDPKEIRGHLYKNGFGQTAKFRMVIVIGRDDSSIMYLPLTSRHESQHDSSHQYILQDNSMTYKKDPDMKSYVEVDSLRAVYARPNWDIQYIGRIMENDMVNIMVKLGKRDIDFESKRDQRTYVSRNKEASFERSLKENGYILSKEEQTEKIYSKDDGRTITKSRWGLVKYHVPLSKEEVTKMIMKREGNPVDDFTMAVTNITKNFVNKESEAIQ